MNESERVEGAGVINIAEEEKKKKKKRKPARDLNIRRFGVTFNVNG